MHTHLKLRALHFSTLTIKLLSSGTKLFHAIIINATL